MDPKLVQYCRENLASFPIEQIRRGLLEEGLDPDEVDSALRAAASAGAASAPEVPAAPAFSWMALFLVLLGGFVLFIWGQGRRESLDEKAKQDRLAAEEEAKAAKPEPVAAPAESTMVGYFGYSLKTPPGWTTTEGVSDARAQREVLHIHPRSMAAATAVDPAALLDAGGILLTAWPRGGQDLSALRESPAARGRRKAAEEDVAGLPLPAFRRRTPDGGVETILQGSRVFYRFAARAADKTYEQILKSLAEPEPRERMRGFVLVEDDPRRGRSYWHDATGAVVTVPPGYSRAPVFLGRGLRYDLAFRHDTDAFEARLRFDPTAEQSAQYQATRLKPCFREGTCPATDPDEPSDLWAAALAGTITAETPRFDIIGPIAALYDFHADWGMLSQGLALSRSRAFNRGYGVGVLLQVHKNAVGNYFVAFLAADYPTLNRHTSDQEDSLVKVDLGIKFPRAR